MFQRRIRQAAGLFVFCICSGSLAADGVSLDSGLPLFADRATLDVTIEGPLSTLIRERSNEDYYEGVLRYSDTDGTERVLDLGFRTRGNFRRRSTTCRFPPVRLNFKRKQVEGTLFEGQNILKLVTHCRPGSSRYEQYVLREELAYRILNLHTPLSFRSRLLRIRWVDTDDDNDVDVRYGFLIEHKNELELRTNMRDADIKSASYDDLEPRQSAIAAVFEYMIGNTDFSMVAAPAGESCCHNGILLRDTADVLNFVPYDFDMAGIVDAPYAEPNPRFNLRGVTDRLYRGHCRFNTELAATAALYLDNQETVMRYVDEQDGMDDSQKKRTKAFLERFYYDLADERRFESRLPERCIGSAD